MRWYDGECFEMYFVNTSTGWWHVTKGRELMVVNAVQTKQANVFFMLTEKHTINYHRRNICSKPAIKAIEHLSWSLFSQKSPS